MWIVPPDVPSPAYEEYFKNLLSYITNPACEQPCAICTGLASVIVSILMIICIVVTKLPVGLVAKHGPRKQQTTPGEYQPHSVEHINPALQGWRSCAGTSQDRPYPPHSWSSDEGGPSPHMLPSSSLSTSLSHSLHATTNNHLRTPPPSKHPRYPGWQWTVD
jgi:hypothetical protein